MSDTDLRKYADIWTKFNVNDVLTALAKTGDDHGIITKTWTLAGTKQDSESESCTLTVKIDVNNITLLGEDNNTTQILKTSNGKLVYCQVDNAADFKKSIAAPAATAGATIALASDITLDSAVTVTGRKVTIQGAHTITTSVKDAFQVESSGQLTFGNRAYDQFHQLCSRSTDRRRTGDKRCNDSINKQPVCDLICNR